MSTVEHHTNYRKYLDPRTLARISSLDLRARHIDWKVYGKTDKIYLKQYLEETNLHLICIVDASESMGYGSVGDKDAPWTKYDHATAIAASMSYMAIQQQDSVGLAIFDN